MLLKEIGYSSEQDKNDVSKYENKSVQCWTVMSLFVFQLETWSEY